MKQYHQLRSKYQTALRRYLVDQQPSLQYAAIFGLPIGHFREWIEHQFQGKFGWEEFGKAWHLETIIPVLAFHLEKESEAAACYHFSNIRVCLQNEDVPFTLLAANRYFVQMLAVINIPQVQLLITKTEQLIQQQEQQLSPLVTFAHQKKETLAAITKLDAGMTDRANRGESTDNLLMEWKLMQRFAQ